MNLSTVIPAYSEHENVFNLLTILKNNGVTFNNTFVISDKPNANSPEWDMAKLISSHRYKGMIKTMEGVIHISKTFHGGHSGIVNYINDLPIGEDENLVVLEDDLFAHVEFFRQCEDFFNTVRSDATPLFVGYSRTNTQLSRFFETYSPLYLWGFALKFGDLKKMVAYHNTVRNYTADEKQKIIDDVMEFSYPCTVFEQYKSQLISLIQKGFLRNSNESADLYFMFYLLQNRLKTVKNTVSYIQSFKPNTFDDKEPNDVEMDIKNLLHSYVE